MVGVERFEGHGWLDWWANSSTLLGRVEVSLIITATGHDWVADPFAKGTWMAWRPGWIAEGRWTQTAEPEGRLFFAGSDIAPEGRGWPRQKKGPESRRRWYRLPSERLRHPRSRGGGAGNLRPLCRDLNSARGARTPPPHSP